MILFTIYCKLLVNPVYLKSVESQELVSNTIGLHLLIRKLIGQDNAMNELFNRISLKGLDVVGLKSVYLNKQQEKEVTDNLI